jgi:hypothetical protein
LGTENRGNKNKKERPENTNKGNRAEEKNNQRENRRKEEAVLVEQPFHTATFVCKQQIPGTDEEGEERERPGDRGLIDKKPGGRRHRPARANRSPPSSSPSPRSCTTPAALPHREHPAVLH